MNVVCRGQRLLCFIFGYMNLIASAVDLACHLVILWMVTNGFSCDVNLTALHNINWPWLEPFRILINIGTHAFYPFPLESTYYDGLRVASPPHCYPWMLHIYQLDLINIYIHVAWLRLAASYIEALYKKDPESMRKFFTWSVFKIICQELYFGYNLFFYSERFSTTYWFINIIDFCVSVYFLLILNIYIKVVRAEKSAPAPVEANHPPSYIDCLTHTQNETNKEPPQIDMDIDKTIVI